ncbi:type III-A CRISPR-associated RAMP protein Csm5 [Desulfolithobacter sp.]
MKSHTQYIELTLASPVSVGCDEVYEPTGFVVDEKAQELIAFDTYTFLEMLDSDALAQFSTICARGKIESLLDLMQFMHRHSAHALGERCALAAGFVEHYENVLKLPRNARIIQQNLNNFKIGRTAFNPHTNLPVIPGSTIKGSLRTAVLNLRQQKNPVAAKQYNRMKPYEAGKENKSLQETLLGGSFNSDPFGLIKVSDFVPVGKCRRKILYAVNLKKRPTGRNSQGPPQLLEVIEPGATFAGTITIITPDRRTPVKKPITKDELFEAVEKFYTSENKRENHELENIGAPPLQIDEDCLPLRIGRHSGAECVTVNGHRSIKISPPGKKPLKFKDHATTLWLASESRKPNINRALRPFGWVNLRLVSDSDGQKLFEQAQGQEKDRQNNISLRAEQRRKEDAARARARLEAREEQKRLEAEAMASAEAEKKMREEWEALSEEQRNLALVRGDEFALKCAPGVDVMRDIWPKVESADPKHQKALARAFKERWMAESKWNVKKKKKKQFEKVQKIKKILGEL